MTDTYCKPGSLFASLLILGATFTSGSALQATPYSDAVNALNPVTYYQFNGAIAPGGTAIDSGSRNGSVTYNGTVSAGAGVPLPGIGGQSLSLTGTATATGTDAGLPSGNSDRTIAMWINSTDSAQNSYNVMLFYGTAGVGNSIFVFVPSSADTNSNPDGSLSGFNSSNTKGNFGVSQYGNGLGGTTWANDGNWHFVAYTQTQNGSQADFRVYVDGALDGGITGYGGPKTMASNTVLGGANSLILGNDIFNDPYSGLMAQLTVFNTALSSSQISNLYSAAFVPEPSSAALAGLALIGLAFAAWRRGTRLSPGA